MFSAGIGKAKELNGNVVTFVNSDILLSLNFGNVVKDVYYSITCGS